jgi:hypothetical protein
MLKALSALGKRRLLVALRGTADIVTSSGPAKTRVQGELILEPTGDQVDRRGLRVSRFSICAASAEGKRGPTGVITVLGQDALGSLVIKGNEGQAELEIPCKLNYESLDRARVKEVDRGCYYQPAFEAASTRVSLTLSASDEKLRCRGGRIAVVCAAGDFGEIFTLILSLKDLAIDMVRPFEGLVQNADANTPYDPCIQVNRRRLICQPVGFRTGSGDPSPTGGTSAAQFATAQTVWNKACMDIEVRATHVIDDATLKTSSDTTAIRNSYTDPDPNVIEVYFVANSLPSIGGGSAGAIGVASCKVVIAEPNSGNPVLLAHELGHVLGLLHPPSATSDPGTVMQPTGSAMNPGTEFVTYLETQSIANPVLQTTVTACCLSHDKGDHFIRDFPVDAGQEPSDPLPAGMTRYSMSNVWNRLTNTAGSWSAATGPDHQSPYRYENDGVTPKTNYLFVRVEQRNNFPVRNASVKYYLKTPGSGGGAANLKLLGSVAVPASLALGAPQDVSLAWTVPAGTPAHSCCFAVVNSPEEPEGTPSSLDWTQFEDMSHQDNDWAQRNLDIEDVAPNTGSGNTWESPPFMIQLPKSARVESLPLTLYVSAVGKSLRGAEIEIPGVASVRLVPGTPVTLKVPKPVVAGEDRPVILRATLPSGLSRGTTASILVDPVLGEKRLIGFGVTFRLASSRATTAFYIDRVLAAAADIAEATDQEEWLSLEGEVRRLLQGRPAHLSALASGILKLPSLKACAQAAVRWPASERFGLRAASERLLKTPRSRQVEEINASFWNFMVRAQMAVPGQIAPVAGGAEAVAEARPAAGKRRKKSR